MRVHLEHGKTYRAVFNLGDDSVGNVGPGDVESLLSMYGLTGVTAERITPPSCWRVSGVWSAGTQVVDLPDDVTNIEQVQTNGVAYG